jgi:hypothetical protein
VYKKQGAALVSIASWADADTKIQLLIDWKKLGIDPSKATIVAPAVTNFQNAKSYSANELIDVPKGKGFMLLVK